MAKESSSTAKKPNIRSRSRVTRARSRINSPNPASSGVSESHADCSSLRPDTKPPKVLGHLVSKSDRKKESKAIHAKCFDEMDKIGRELQLALAEKNDQKAYESQLLQKTQATKAEEGLKLKQAIALKETALAENKKFQNEVRQLQQQVELLNASTQDNVPWNDVQPILHQTHGELVSATTRYWNAIDALQNRRLAYLPGSGVIHGNWAEQYGPLGSLGHDPLPGFTESGNQREPGANNVFDSLM
ncbi:hypothetical protein N7520_008487 [Penicillium odoratum]|uniref:uncharacterized protein n=1 Tax=Penicillium odoratum TaxID=1167516 RepID=UPI0025476172|nr:uncharacterized protein N7520_008487 [Penicillium odoratum]KAJ5751570.1 hypothetical protein N7520_008487 [Penicillium odoratum]